MPQLCQTVTFSKQDIQAILVEKAKEQIKTETGKEPTGSNSCKFVPDSADGDGVIVQFNCNGTPKPKS